VRFKDGRPEGSYENFVTGFWVSGQHRAEVWGRPAALAVMKDGSLLIADDAGGTIWRVSYTGPKDRAHLIRKPRQGPRSGSRRHAITTRGRKFQEEVGVVLDSAWRKSQPRWRAASR
jgi:hypothetical protein